jgi:hypothetical protein
MTKDRVVSFAELRKRPVDGFSAGLVDDDNLMEWDIMIMGYVNWLLFVHSAGHGNEFLEVALQISICSRPADTLYEGAFLKARLTFPEVCIPCILAPTTKETITLTASSHSIHRSFRRQSGISIATTQDEIPYRDVAPQQ